MGDMLEKVKFLREKFSLLNIEVDGGVGPNTIQTCANHGANMIVAGTAIINSLDRKATIATLKKAVEDSIEYK